MAEIVDLTQLNSVDSSDHSTDSSTITSEDDQLMNSLDENVPSSHLKSNLDSNDVGINIGTQNSTDSTPEFEYPIYDMHRFKPVHVYTTYYGGGDSVWSEPTYQERSFASNSKDVTWSTGRSWQDSGAQAPDSPQSVQKSL